MIEYRVECQVNDEFAESWEEYFLNTHLDDVLGTGCFTGYQFTKDTDLSQEYTIFVTSYFCTSIDKLDFYNRNHADNLKADVLSKFEGKFKAYRNVFHILKSKTV